VRNLRDGDVEVEAEGTVEAVDAMIKWLRRGPSLARVTGSTSMIRCRRPARKDLLFAHERR
jgi:acylphosphatase